jgi:hemerythrin-like domain-containing protein
MQMLDEIQPLNPADSQFKAKIEQLRTAVRNHINQEENDIFPKLRDNFSTSSKSKWLASSKQQKASCKTKWLLPKSAAS